MINVISFDKLGLEFIVNRAAFKIGGFPIYWYGILIATGLLLASLYAFSECKKTSVSSEDFLNMLLIAIPVSIICARLYFVIFSFDSYKNNLADVFDIRSGGLAIYGGIIGAFIVIISYCRIKKTDLFKVLDIVAVGLLIGQAIGRWGNFVNGEAFGGFTNLAWAMTIKSDGVLIAESVHPTFLYESLWNALGLLLLLIYKKHKKFDGELISIYFMWYGLGRAFIEGLRADSLYIGSFRASQLLSCGIIILGALIMIIKRLKIKSEQ